MRSNPAALILPAIVCFSLPAAAQVTTRMSVNSSGLQGDGQARHGIVSADGRFVVFWTDSDNLDPADTNGLTDVFVRDRTLATTTLVSVSSAGVVSNGSSFVASISADGRFVGFWSNGNNLVPGDTNGGNDVFVRDRLNSTTECISVTPSGTPGNAPSFDGMCSADGRFVAFQSSASDLVAGDTNGFADIFVRDRQSGTTLRVSLGLNGAESNGSSWMPTISADGQYVAFLSTATNLVPSDTNNQIDVFVRDVAAGTNRRANVTSSGQQANDISSGCMISGEGRYVVFDSYASNLVAGDTNSTSDVFVRDLLTGVIERESVDSAGNQATGVSRSPSISADGQYVAFGSFATNLVGGDTNGTIDIFVRDRSAGTTVRASLDSSGGQANGPSEDAVISASGRYVAFYSLASNLVPLDGNSTVDVFVRDLQASGFASACEPGSAGVIPCPCGNPPAGAGRGCDNSSATGGAALAASGAAYLFLDTLVFTTSGERPTALSLLMQGDAFLPNGVPFGQGVRCAGGALKRLYAKTAVGGSISAPDFGAGDPSVSTRSAQLGAPIQPGLPYAYFVYYRDGVVLGGCPASSGFNATQTGSISWWP